MKKIFSLLLLVFAVLPAFALYTIKGKVIDATTNKPIDYVTVALYKPDGQTLAKGVTSDEKGNFVLPTVANGKYILKLSYVGYTTVSLPLNVTDKELDMGAVKLTEDSKTLSEVEVVGQGTQMRFEVDKKVFTVDQNIASAGGSATEVLQNIPSVDVDNEGNVSLRNSSSVEVWINGKPSGLTAENRAQILQQMPAESIESIELMTNPSAKFNPEGTAGIINLVLKKNRKAGYYGSVSAGLMLADGAKPGGTLGANVNYSSSKLDAYLNVGYRAMNFVGGSVTNRSGLASDGSQISSLFQETVMERGFGGFFGRAGVDYHINDKNTVSLSGFGMLGSGYSTTTIENTMKNFVNNTTREYSRLNTGEGIHQSMNITLDYKYDIDTKGSNLMASLSYSPHLRESSETYVQTESGATGSNITQDVRGTNKELQFKLDFTKKISDATKLEMGWQTTDQTRKSPNHGYDNTTSPSTEINSYYNEFTYDETIHAAYATLGTRFDKLSVQGGLRAEYMQKGWENKYYNSTGNLITDLSNPYNKLQLFPSAFLSYSLPQKNELQLNFTRRINRPRGREINPFRNYSDSTNISYGNPDLLPELTTAMEFNYLKTWDSHSLSASAYYRFTDNVMQGVQYVNNGVMESTTMNVSRTRNTGVELVAKNRLFKIMNLTSSLNFYHNKLDSGSYTSIYDNSVVTTIPEQQLFSWSARLMANVMLGRTTSFQLTGDYSAPRLIAQGKETASYAIDLGLRQTFLDKKISLNLMVRDLLNSRSRNTITWGNSFYQTNESYFHGRMIGLTATYNFGNTKPKQGERRRAESQSDMNMDGGME